MHMHMYMHMHMCVHVCVRVCVPVREAAAHGGDRSEEADIARVRREAPRADAAL